MTIFFSFASQSANAATLSHQPNNLGLIAYWSFNEGKGTQVNDFSGSGNSGTLSGTTIPSWANGKRGGALNFDGSSSYITGSGSALPNVGVAASTTISAWIKPTSTSGTREIFTKGASGNCFNYGMVMVGGVLSARNSNNDYALGSASITANIWQHVTVVFGSAGATGYVNGVQVGTNASGATTNCATNNWSIGTRAYNALSEFFPGIIDDVRIYNRALSATDVLNVYTSGQIVRKNISNNNLIGYWPMNEGKGSQAGDFSGNNLTGSLTGGTWANGKRGGALSFNGTSDKVSGGNITIGANMTISAWIFKNSSTGQKSFFSNRGGAGNVYFGLSGTQVFLYDNAGSPPNITSASGAVQIGKWQHIVATSNASTTIFYVNGVQVASNSQNRGSSTGTFGIGWDPSIGTEYWDGLIDDARVYNRTLSATEIATLYNLNETNLNHNQNSRSTNGLVGFWTFNGTDMTTSTSTDVSGNGNNGTLSGGLTKTMGKVGQALNFDGSSGLVNINSSTSLDVTSFSIGLWWKATSITAWGGPFSNRVASKNGFQFVNDVISTSVFSPHLVVWNGTSETAQFKASSYTIPIPFDSYHHFVWTYTGGTANLYVDGVAQAVTTSAVTNYPQTGITIGKSYANIGGNIDEVRVYNRALSATEAQQLYLMGK